MKRSKLLFFLLAFIFGSCNQPRFTEGLRIYKTNCSNCHMDDGSGLGALIPALTTSPYIKSNHTAIICKIHNGVNADYMHSERYMPSFEKLSDVDMTNLLNYLQEIYNKSKYQYQLDSVAAGRKRCVEI